MVWWVVTNTRNPKSTNQLGNQLGRSGSCETCANQKKKEANQTKRSKQANRKKQASKLKEASKQTKESKQTKRSKRANQQKKRPQEYAMYNV